MTGVQTCALPIFETVRPLSVAEGLERRIGNLHIPDVAVRGDMQLNGIRLINAIDQVLDVNIDKMDILDRRAALVMLNDDPPAGLQDLDILEPDRRHVCITLQPHLGPGTPAIRDNILKDHVMHNLIRPLDYPLEVSRGAWLCTQRVIIGMNKAMPHQNVLTTIDVNPVVFASELAVEHLKVLNPEVIGLLRNNRPGAAVADNQTVKRDMAVLVGSDTGNSYRRRVFAAPGIMK